VKTARSVIFSPSPSARFRLGHSRGQVVLLCALLSLLSACWQAPPSLDQATEQLAPEGGRISLPGGVAATFGAGILASPTEVTLALSDTPEAYPEAIASEYPAGAAAAVAPSVNLSFPSSALGSNGELAIRVPTVVPQLGDEERLLMEVHLFLADGQHLFFFEP